MSVDADERPPLVEEDWSFLYIGAKLDEEGYSGEIKNPLPDDPKEIERMTAYELAREAWWDRPEARFQHQRWQQIYSGYFPDDPYLLIPKEERSSLWQRAEASNVPTNDLVRIPDRGIFPQYEYALKDKYQDAAEEAAYGEQYQDAGLPDESCESKPVKGPPLPEFPERTTRPSITGITEDDCELSQIIVRLTLNMDYPDAILGREFLALLKNMRKTDPIMESRGSTPAKSYLKQLAAKRLMDHYETAGKAATFLSKGKHFDPYLKSGESGWNKARGNIRSLISRGGHLPPPSKKR